MTYQETHPWITFSLDLGKDPQILLYNLGRACAMIKELTTAAVSPEIHRELNRISLIRGVLGSTAIEGNTLTEKEVEDILEHRSRLSPSRQYLGQEVQNVVDACNMIVGDVCTDSPSPLTPAYICNLNRLVLENLKLGEDVQPGVIRQHSVLVGNYRGAPAGECEELLRRLCAWLSSDAFRSGMEGMHIAMSIIQAIVAHVYLAWIHPFGDGNGRTARLVEVFLLLRAGVPVPAAHLLSNFYNSTRSRYYTELSELSRPKQGRYPLDSFLSYAVEGLVDGLENQLSLVSSFHLHVIWENHVYSQFRKKKGEHHKRLRDLLLSLRVGELHRISSMSDLLPDLYHEHYRNKTLRTLQRDLRTLVSEDYLESTPSGYRPKTEILQSMLPKRAQTNS